MQVLFLKNLTLFDTAFCFLYVAFILMLPLEIGPLLLILIGFVMGLTIDIFYDSIGINAAACVFIAFIRPFWLSLITPRGGYEEVNIPKLKTLGFSWFFAYSLPLIFVHHVVLFYLEAGNMHMFFFTLSKVIFSTILTFIIVVLSQNMFYRKPL